MPKRELYLSRYIASFIISTFVFLMFFLIANSVSYLNYREISSENNLILQSISHFDGVLSEFTCNEGLLIDSSDKLDRVASKLTLLEKRFGKKDSRVLEQKKLYSELEYRHFNIVEKFNSVCNNSYVTVLFFYSNLNDRESESERMGFILTAFEREDADNVMIYSFDYDLNTSVTASLVMTYNVTRVPVAIVNGRDALYVRNIRELERYLV